MTRPIDAIIVDNIKVPKGSFRNYIAARLAFVLASASEIESLDMAGCLAVLLGKVTYAYDAADTTTAHDGETCLVSFDGRRYKPALGLPAGSVGADELADGAIEAKLGFAPADADVVADLVSALGGDMAFATTVANALAARLRVDTASQGLTSTQKSNARANLDLGSAALLAESYVRDADNLNAGTVSDARLPSRLLADDLDGRYGFRTLGQQVISDATYTLTSANIGRNILVVTAGAVITMPAASAAGNGGLILLTNVSSDDITLALAGSDSWDLASATIPPSRTVMLVADSSGTFWRAPNQGAEFRRTDADEFTVDGTNDRIPFWDASAGAFRLTSPTTIAGSNTAGVSTFQGRAGSVSLIEADFPDQLGADGTLATPADGTDTTRPGWYFYSGATEVPYSGNWIILHSGDVNDARRYAWDVVTGALYRSLELSGGGPGAWAQVYETEAEITGVTDARYLRRLSSGILSTADSATLDHDGDSGAATTNAAELNTLLDDLPNGGVLEVHPGTIYTDPLTTVNSKTFTMEGRGKRISTLIMKGTSGDLLKVVQDTQNRRFTARRLSVLKHSDGNTAGAAFRVEYPVTSSHLANTAVVEDVECRGVDGTTTFGALFRPKNAWNTKWHDLEFEGVADNTTPAVAAVDLLGKCTVAHGDLVKAFWAQYGGTHFEGGYFSEGGYLSRYHCVACDWILFADDGQDAPGLSLHMMHGETFYGGIKLINHPQARIDDLLVYKRLTSTQNWTAVWLEGSGGYGQDYSQIAGVRGWGAKGASAGGTAVGFVIDDSDATLGSNLMLWDMDLGADLFNNSTARLEIGYSNVTTLSQNVPAGASVTGYSLPASP